MYYTSHRLPSCTHGHQTSLQDQMGHTQVFLEKPMKKFVQCSAAYPSERFQCCETPVKLSIWMGVWSEASQHIQGISWEFWGFAFGNRVGLYSAERERAHTNTHTHKHTLSGWQRVKRERERERETACLSKYCGICGKTRTSFQNNTFTTRRRIER